MKSFIAGVLVGLIVAFPLGSNVGKGVPMFSNPFAEKPLSKQISDTAQSATEKLKRTTNELVEDTKQAIEKVTQ